METPNENIPENSPEGQAYPPSPANLPVEEPPQMSEAATLGSIFFEPGETFEDLRRKPRFVLALLITIIAMTAFSFLFFGKLGEERLRRSVIEQVEKNPQVQSLPAEKKKQQIEIAYTFTKYSQYALPLLILIATGIGTLLYWAGGKAMGGSGNFMHALSVWVYSSFPPTLVLMLANIVVLFLKSPDEIDINSSQRGLVNANPSFLMDGKEMPVLATLLSTFDLFQIWGWILAAIGLNKVMKISKGSAWAVVLFIALIGVAFRMVSALMSGNAL